MTYYDIVPAPKYTPRTDPASHHTSQAGPTSQTPPPDTPTAQTTPIKVRHIPSPSHKKTRSEDSSSWKEAILVSAATQCQASPRRVSIKRARFHAKPYSSSSDDNSSESSLSGDEYEDHWTKTGEEAIRDRDWDIANKIMAFPITVRVGGRLAESLGMQCFLTNSKS